MPKIKDLLNGGEYSSELDRQNLDVSQEQEKVADNYSHKLQDYHSPVELDAKTKAVLALHGSMEALKDQIYLTQLLNNLNGGGGGGGNQIAGGGGNPVINNAVQNYGVPGDLSNVRLGQYISLGSSPFDAQVVKIDKNGRVTLKENWNPFNTMYHDGIATYLGERILADMTLNSPNQAAGILASFFPSYADPQYIYEKTKAITDKFLGNEAVKQLAEQREQLAEQLKKAKTPEEREIITKNLEYIDERTKQIYKGDLQAMLANSVINIHGLGKLNQQSNDIATKGFDRAISQSGVLVNAERYLSNQKQYSELAMREYYAKKAERINEYYRTKGQEVSVTDKEVETVLGKLKTNSMLTEREALVSEFLQGAYYDVNILQDIVNHRSFVESLENISEYTGWANRKKVMSSGMTDDGLYRVINPEYRMRSKGKNYGYSVLQEGLHEEDRKVYSGIAIGGSFADKRDGAGESFLRAVGQSLGTTIKVGYFLIPGVSRVMQETGVLNTIDALSPVGSVKAERSFYKHNPYGRDWNFSVDKLVNTGTHFVVDLATGFGVGTAAKIGLSTGAKFLSRFAAKEGTAFVGKNLARKGSEFMVKAATKEVALLKGIPYAGRISFPTIVGGGIIDAQQVWQEGDNAGVNPVANNLTALGTMLAVGTLENVVDLDGFGRQIMGVKLGFKDIPKESATELAKVKGLKGAYQYAKQKLGVDVPKVADEANTRSVFDATVHNTLAVDVQQEMFRKAKGIKKENVFTEVVASPDGQKIQKFYRLDEGVVGQKVDDLGTVTPADMQKAGVEQRFVKDGQLYEVTPEGEVVRTPLIEVNEYGLTPTEVAESYKIGIEKAKNKFGKFAFLTKPAKFILGSALEGVTEITQDVSMLGLKTLSNAIDTAMGLTVTDSEYESIYNRMRKGEKVSGDELDDFFRRGIYDTHYTESDMIEAGLAGAMFGAGANVAGRMRQALSGKSPEKEFLRKEQEYRNNLAASYGLNMEKEEDRVKLDEIYSNSFNLTRMVHLGLEQDYLLNLRKLVKRGLVGESYYQEQKDFIDSYKTQMFLYEDPVNKAWSKIDYALKNGASADVAKALYIAKLRHKDNLMAARNRLRKITDLTTVAEKNVSPDFFSMIQQSAETQTHQTQQTQQTLAEIERQYDGAINNLAKDEEASVNEFINNRNDETAKHSSGVLSLYDGLIQGASEEAEKDILSKAREAYERQFNSVMDSFEVGKGGNFVYFDPFVGGIPVSGMSVPATVKDFTEGKTNAGGYEIEPMRLKRANFAKAVSELLASGISYDDARAKLDETKARIQEELGLVQNVIDAIAAGSDKVNDFYAKAISYREQLNQIDGILDAYSKVLNDRNTFDAEKAKFASYFNVHKNRFDFTEDIVTKPYLYLDVYEEYRKWKQDNPVDFANADELSKIKADRFFEGFLKTLHNMADSQFQTETAIIKEGIAESGKVNEANTAVLAIYTAVANQEAGEGIIDALNTGNYSLELLLEMTEPIVKKVKEELSNTDMPALAAYSEEIAEMFGRTESGSMFPERGDKGFFPVYDALLKGNAAPGKNYIPFVQDVLSHYSRLANTDQSAVPNAFFGSLYSELLKKRHEAVPRPSAGTAVKSDLAENEFREKMAQLKFESAYNDRKDIYDAFRDYQAEIRKVKQQFVDRKDKLDIDVPDVPSTDISVPDVSKTDIRDPDIAKRAIEDYNTFVEPIKEILRKIETDLEDTERFLEKEYHETVKDVDAAIESSNLKELKSINTSYLDPEIKEYYKDKVKENIPSFIRFYFLQRGFKHFVPVADKIIQPMGAYTSPSHYESQANQMNTAHWIATVNHLFNNPAVAKEVVSIMTEEITAPLENDIRMLLEEGLNIIRPEQGLIEAIEDSRFEEVIIPDQITDEDEARSLIMDAMRVSSATANDTYLRLVKVNQALSQRIITKNILLSESVENAVRDLMVLPQKSTEEYAETLKKMTDDIAKKAYLLPVADEERAAVSQELYQAMLPYLGLIDRAMNPNADASDEKIIKMRRILNGTTAKNGTPIGNEQTLLYNRTNIYGLASVLGLGFGDRMPNRESLNLILDGILSQGQGGLYNEALLEQMNLKDIDNLIALLEDIDFLINANENIGVDANTLHNSGITLKSITENFREELESLKEAATNMAIIKHNRSILETENAIKTVVSQIAEADDTDDTLANIKTLREWANRPYYVTERFGRLTYYRYDETRLEELFNALKGIVGMEKYFDAENDYLSNSNVTFPYSVVQRLNSWLYTYGYINKKYVYVSGQGGTGKTSSIKLALETIARMDTSSGKPFNVHIAVPNESLAGNKAYNDYTNRINASIEVLSTDYNRETYEKYLDEIIKKWNGQRGIIVFDEYTLFNGELNSAITKKLADNPDAFVVFNVFDMGQMSHTNNYGQDGLATLFIAKGENNIYGFSSNVIWRNANYGLSKAIETSAFSYGNDSKGVPYSVPRPKRQTIKNLSENLYLSDDGLYGADAVQNEKEFFRQAVSALNSGKSVFVLTASAEEAEALKKQNPELESVIFSVSEKQGSEADVVYFYTKRLSEETNDEWFQSVLYTGTTRAKEKVVYSGHLFNAAGAVPDVSVYKTDQTVTGQGMTFAMERNNELMQNTNPKNPNKNASFQQTQRITTTITDTVSVEKTPPPMTSAVASAQNTQTDTQDIQSVGVNASSVRLTMPAPKENVLKEKQKKLNAEKTTGALALSVSLLPDIYDTTVC